MTTTTSTKAAPKTAAKTTRKAPAKAAAKTTTKAAPKAAKEKTMVKAGGEKGQRIIEVIKADKSLTRRQVADKAGATVGRVGEVVRYLTLHGTAEEKKVVAHLVAKAPAPKAAKAAPKRTAKADPKAEDIKTEEDAVKAVDAIVNG